MGFLDRVDQLPHLGLGVSTEYGAGAAGLNIAALHDRYPGYAQFLEVGVEVHSGLDQTARAWIERGLPATYHFLDINLDDPADFDRAWIERVRELTGVVQPAWLCGDAGLWHFGARDPGQMLLLPPILSAGSADAMAAGVVTLREAVDYEVFPENPPGSVFLGDHHLVDYFARVVAGADSGMLLDCAHLAIYQRHAGHPPLTALDGFPLERVVELHVAGGTERRVDGWHYIEDDHTPHVLDDTWNIFEWLVERCSNLKAVVFECERNRLPETLGGFGRILDTLAGSPHWPPASAAATS